MRRIRSLSDWGNDWRDREFVFEAHDGMDWKEAMEWGMVCFKEFF